MEILTDRLLLRPLAESDEPAWFELQSDDGIREYLDGTDDPAEAQRRLKEEVRLFEASGLGFLAVLKLGGDEIIGLCGLRRSLVDDGTDYELQCGLLPDYRKQGFATEASRAVAGWALKERADVSRLLGVVRADNSDSLCLLARLGMVYVELREVLNKMKPPELIYELRFDSDEDST